MTWEKLMVSVKLQKQILFTILRDNYIRSGVLNRQSFLQTLT
jgi:hypothetical protein